MLPSVAAALFGHGEGFVSVDFERVGMTVTAPIRFVVPAFDILHEDGDIVRAVGSTAEIERVGPFPRTAFPGVDERARWFLSVVVVSLRSGEVVEISSGWMTDLVSRLTPRDSGVQPAIKPRDANLHLTFIIVSPTVISGREECVSGYAKNIPNRL